MSDYRSELRAAKERIEQLEAELRRTRESVSPRRKDQHWTPTRILLTIGLLLPLVALGSISTCVVKRQIDSTKNNKPTIVVSTPPPPVESASLGLPPRPSDSLRWYVEHAPLLPATQKSGEPPNLLGWMRDSRNDLHVVAIDRASLTPRWISRVLPGIPGPTARKNVMHLAVAADHVIATEAEGNAVVFRLRDGVELASHHIGKEGVAEMCAQPSTTTNNGEVFLALDARYWRPRFEGDVGATLNMVEKHRQRTFLFDIEKSGHGRVRPAPLTARCRTSIESCDDGGGDGDQACRSFRALSRTPPSTLQMSASGGYVWQEGDNRVSIAPSASSNILSAVGWSGATGRWLWTTTIPSLDHPQRPREPMMWVHTVVRSGNLYAMYPTEAGPWRVVAIDIRTGERRFDVQMIGSHIGSNMRSLVTDGNALFVSMNDDLFVLDTRNGGALIKRVDIPDPTTKGTPPR